MTATGTLRDRRGRMVALESKPLGRGGEGTVYAVSGHANVVAKLYHQPPDALRARKLGAMVGLASPRLQAVCAWPGELLSDGQGRTVGLLMPRVDLARARPIHDLTGPASRLKHFPQADYRFLVRAARNLAAAVATIHAHGPVIGDLNAANVYVTGQATVTLIDTDSFQVVAGAERFLCPVGTAEFTPPELQGADLSRTPRTENHDAFGLATLIFQLLFLGHYPWAGVYEGGRHLSIPEAIRAHHFAWGRGAGALGLRPPPAAPTLDSLPPSIGALFERAFGPGHARPAAAEWVAALEQLHSGLVTCALNAGHVHTAGQHCPWCALEARTATVFFRPERPPLTTVAPVGGSPNDVEALWRAVEAVPPPPHVTLRLPDQAVPRPAHYRARRLWATFVMVLSAASLCGAFLAIPNQVLGVLNLGGLVAAAYLAVVTLIAPRLALPPLPASPHLRARRWWTSLVVLLVCTVCSAFPVASFVLTVVSLLTCLLAGPMGLLIALGHGERADIKRQLKALHAQMRKLKADFEGRAEAHAQYLATRAELAEVHRALTGQAATLAAREQRAAEEHQRRVLREYLDTQLLDAQRSPGVGEKRLWLLLAHGIVTAADLEAGRLAGVPGIGGKTARQLLAWRSSLEDAFRARGLPALPPAVRHDLARQMAQEARRLREQLSHGPAALRHTHRLAAEAHARAQAELDGHVRTHELLVAML